MRSPYSLFCCFLMVCFLLIGCKQEKKKSPTFPFFASLKARKVNARCGPGFSYPIEWVYTQKFLPVEVLESYEHWYKIQDASGDLSWVNKNMIGKLKASLTRHTCSLRQDPSPESPSMATIDPHTLVDLKSCTNEWCTISIERLTGFLPKKDLYGT